jgi:hypothetical protein
MKIKNNARGFKVGTFYDYYDVECSIQESSLATRSCIWLGTDTKTIKTLIPGKGWTSRPIKDDELVSTRMHLTRRQVKSLLPYLQKFVKTGRL